MTTKEILDIRKASLDLQNLSERVRTETEVLQACIRTLDDIAHDVQNTAYDVGVSAANLSEEEEPDNIRPEDLKFVADLATGVSGLFMNRAIDFLAELGARLEVYAEFSDEVLAPREEPETVDHSNRFRLALHVLNNASYYLGEELYEHVYSKPVPF